jgi:XRE family aerobic/anaerobic benzoate catabolism transcriptional regulator
MSLGQIFELHGGAYYRKLEREELERLIASGATGIVVTGGSLVKDRGSFELLRRSAVTIWLEPRRRITGAAWWRRGTRGRWPTGRMR